MASRTYDLVFEAMVLSRYVKGYKRFDEKFAFLFNSYSETLGARQPRPRRGMVTRPTLDEIYRTEYMSTTPLRSCSTLARSMRLQS